MSLSFCSLQLNMKPVECTTTRVNTNVNEDFEWQRCVSVGSLVVINMTPVQGVDEGGSAYVGAGAI